MRCFVASGGVTREPRWGPYEMAAVRFIPPGKWTRKPKAKHFLIRDKAKADRLEKAWKAKSKRK